MIFCITGVKSWREHNSSNSAWSRIRQPMKDALLLPSLIGMYRLVLANLGNVCVIDCQHFRLSIAEYNQHQMDSAFNGDLHDCSVCFQQKFGYQSIKFQGCNHVYCKGCMSEYFKVKIEDGSVQSLNCPSEKCASTALPNQVSSSMRSEALKSEFSCTKLLSFCPYVAKDPRSGGPRDILEVRQTVAKFNFEHDARHILLSEGDVPVSRDRRW